MEELGVGAGRPADASAADATGGRDVVDEGRVGIGVGTRIAGSRHERVEQQEDGEGEQTIIITKRAKAE